MVEYAEQYNAGSLNGIILRHSQGNIIDTAGELVDEMLYPHSVGTENPAPWIIKKPFYISYANAAYALYNIRCILSSMGEKLFFDEFFGYVDDYVLGLILWNHGYKNIAIPEIVAVHRRGSTFGRHGATLSTDFLFTRNRIALCYLTNVRYKHRIGLHAVRIVSSKIYKKDVFNNTIVAYSNGLRLGKMLRKKYNLFIDLYRGPVLKISQGEFIRYYIVGTKIKLHRYIQGKIARLIKNLEVD